MKTNRKGEVSGLTAAAIAIIVLIFVVVIGANIVDSLGSSTCPAGSSWKSAHMACCKDSSATCDGAGNKSTSYASNLTNQGLNGGMKTFGDYFSIVVLIAIAGLIIMLLLRSFRAD